jgi:hypothetical protein
LVSTPLLFAADTFHVALGIAGGAFVLWAVLVAGIGMARPQFPGGIGGQRAVIAVTVVLAAVVMGVAVQVG